MRKPSMQKMGRRELLCGALECGSLLPLFPVSLLAVI